VIPLYLLSTVSKDIRIYKNFEKRGTTLKPFGWDSQHASHAHLDTMQFHLDNLKNVEQFKVILYSYLILKKMNERITDS